ncbi:MAG: hypothetical protein A2Z50_08265 [Nitrospirae bacterium RBG_19FT_COMBO_42_15]|nr:MAG: hypothetical protein A2Z50_08265 [Nitrospirae bacterium RBG_19FT_COMBO_42_15]
MSRMWEYFQCQRCGACCTQIGLPYDGNSVFEIADFLKMPVDEVIKNYYGNITSDGWESDDNKRTPCPFLKYSDDKYSCKIYSVRPPGCRLYPIDTNGGRQGITCPAWEIAFSKLKKEQKEEKI